MSLLAARQFVKARLELLGFEEWADTIDATDVPDQIQEKVYHVRNETCTGVKLNMHDLVVEAEHRITIFKQGFQNPGEAVDSAMTDCEAIITDLLTPANRLAGGHLNIVFRNYTLEPISKENDAAVRAVLIFNVQVSLGVT